MARKPWKPTKSQLKKIEALVSAGATKGAICKAIGVTYPTLSKYLGEGLPGSKLKKQLIEENNPKKDKIYSKSSNSLKKAWENGLEERYNRIKNNCIDSMDIKTKVYEYQETRTKEGYSEKKGSYEETVITNKRVLPDTTMIIFALKNLIPETFQQKDKVVKKEEENLSIEVNFIKSEIKDD